MENYVEIARQIKLFEGDALIKYLKDQGFSEVEIWHLTK